jgi:hypothetical protein
MMACHYSVKQEAAYRYVGDLAAYCPIISGWYETCKSLLHSSWLSLVGLDPAAFPADWLPDAFLRR